MVRRSLYDGSVIDCDVHHLPRAATDVVAYLPEEWRDTITLSDGKTWPLSGAKPLHDHPDGVNIRFDTLPEQGGPGGSDYALLRDQLLDPYGIEAAHLNWGGHGSLTNGDLANALCCAENDWCADVWLDRPGDSRLCASLVVPTHDPERGAQEIRRAGANPRFASAHLSYLPFGRPMGHTIYDPIYAAAAELGLPLYLHGNVGAQSGGGVEPLVSGGSDLSYRFESFSTQHQWVASHVASMIVHGVFERYPTLRLMLAEHGLSWVPGFAIALDSNYELMRRESKWVRRRPSEYLHDHVLMTTQPCEATPESRQWFIEHLSLLDGIEDMLCFSTDYPHWDTDIPSYVQSILPKRWHEKVFSENARRALRLSAPVRDLTPAAP
jgi:predicted TIM-barrel fold metal-dependent hydrolase